MKKMWKTPQIATVKEQDLAKVIAAAANSIICVIYHG